MNAWRAGMKYEAMEERQQLDWRRCSVEFLICCNYKLTLLCCPVPHHEQVQTNHSKLNVAALLKAEATTCLMSTFEVLGNMVHRVSSCWRHFTEKLACAKTCHLCHQSLRLTVSSFRLFEQSFICRSGHFYHQLITNYWGKLTFEKRD